MAVDVVVVLCVTCVVDGDGVVPEKVKVFYHIGMRIWMPCRIK